MAVQVAPQKESLQEKTLASTGTGLQDDTHGFLVTAEQRNRLRVHAPLICGSAIRCSSLLHRALPLAQLVSELCLCQRTVLVVGNCAARLDGIRAAVQIRLPMDVAHLFEHF